MFNNGTGRRMFSCGPLSFVPVLESYAGLPDKGHSLRANAAGRERCQGLEPVRLSI